MTNEEEIIDPLLEAKDTLDAVTFAHGDTVGSYADYALAQATVALVEEQRTTNLIAYLNTGPHSWGYQPSENVLKSVQAQIEERLGLA